jgi:hypothetical protein
MGRRDRAFTLAGDGATEKGVLVKDAAGGRSTSYSLKNR